MKEILLDSVELSNGETMGYRKVGNGDKILILIHGNMSTSKHWDTVMESMPDQYTTYALDLRGFGISSYNRPINSLRDLSEDLKLFVEKMNLEKFYLAGWSTGGGVVMHFAIDYPEYLEKLILVESVGIKGYPMFKKDENGQPILSELIKTKEEIAVDPVQVLPILNAYEKKDKDFLRMVCDATIYTFKKPEKARYEAYLEEVLTQRNLVEIDYSLVHFNISGEHNGVLEGSNQAHKIEVETLVMQGKDDLVVPMDMGLGIAKGIGDNAKLVLLDDGGHAPMVDDLDRFMNLILSFME